MSNTVNVPVELWRSVKLALQEAKTDLDDASTVVDKSEEEEYAYQNTLEMLTSVHNSIEVFEKASGLS